MTPDTSRFWAVYAQATRAVVRVLEALAATGILVMMTVTCLEVILRVFRVSITGVVDIVRIAGAVTMAGALPYTTACKGHVAIEYFYQKLSRRWRTVVDAISRSGIILLFGFFAVQCARYGMTLKERGQVTLTLELPEFWVPFVLALSCAAVCMVTVYHLFHPGRELIKP